MTSPARIVLFDGHCAVCDGFVRWLIDRDPGGLLSFAPLQGETAARLRERHPEIPEDDDTVVLVETGEPESAVWLRSDAVLRILGSVAGPWRHVSRLRWLPRFLRDGPYRLFVRVRYRIFGRIDVCPIPSPELARRFLA